VGRNAGRLDEAERALNEALALLEQLTVDEPANYRWRFEPGQHVDFARPRAGRC